jgi:hypothetical protein
MKHGEHERLQSSRRGLPPCDGPAAPGPRRARAFTAAHGAHAQRNRPCP